jgi:hypothetical protein
VSGKALILDPIEAAVLRTVLYADVFSFAITPEEIHHFLISDTPVPLSRIQSALTQSPLLKHKLEHIDGCVVMRGRADLVSLRSQRERIADQLMPQAIGYGHWLARIPFVRMVAITGALSMRNAADTHDDLDYALVTASSRVWLARAFSILLVRALKLRGVVLCPNYVLAETALAQEQQDLFIAHEVVQMIPIFGYRMYESMRTSNAWVSAYLPNAQGVFYWRGIRVQQSWWMTIKTVLEWLLGGRIGDALETWEYRRKLRRFAPEMETPHHAAALDEQRVKGHFVDHGHRIMREYAARLRQHDLELYPLPIAGD